MKYTKHVGWIILCRFLSLKLIRNKKLAIYLLFWETWGWVGDLCVNCPFKTVESALNLTETREGNSGQPRATRLLSFPCKTSRESIKSGYIRGLSASCNIISMLRRCRPSRFCHAPFRERECRRWERQSEIKNWGNRTPSRPETALNTSVIMFDSHTQDSFCLRNQAGRPELFRLR